VVLSSGQANAEIDNDGEPSLTALHEAPIVFPTLAAGAHPGGANGQDAGQIAAASIAAAVSINSDSRSAVDSVAASLRSGHRAQQAIGNVGRPRRLLPIETERLMGWPDAHTTVGINEKGAEYRLSDSVRYRLCGNGVASPVAAWIGWRLRDALVQDGELWEGVR
jgi:site-specific DNA-cytosine methylase